MPTTLCKRITVFIQNRFIPSTSYRQQSELKVDTVSIDKDILMGKYTRKSRLSSLTIVASLLLGFSCTLPVAFGKEYHVVAGSQVIVRSVNQQLPPADETRAVLISDNTASFHPYLGGFSLESGVCSREPFTQIDGWNGISINSVGIIAGFTGSITGGVTTVFEHDNPDNKTIFQGGLLFDSRGFSSGTGNINTEQALHYGCATFQPPYPAGSFRNNNLIYAPSNNDKGNKVATVDGDFAVKYQCLPDQRGGGKSRV